MRTPFLILATAGLLMATLAAAEKDQPPATPADKEAYGFRFLYPDKGSPKEYLRAHPCVAGHWRCDKVTDTHWVGGLHYPTGNVAPTYPKDDEPAFVVQPIKIERIKGLPVDPGTWEGDVILLQADATVRFASVQSLQSSFRIVAVETAKGKAVTFLFKKEAELRYTRSP